MTWTSQPAVPRTWLTLLVLIVLTAHALLLGLLQGVRRTPVDGVAGALVFQTRLVVLGPPQSAIPAVPAAAFRSVPEPSHPSPNPRLAAPPAPISADLDKLFSENGKNSTPSPDEPIPPSTPPQYTERPGIMKNSPFQDGGRGAMELSTGQSPQDRLARWPRPAIVTYQAYLAQTGPQGAHVTALASTLDWRHDGRSYGLRWRVFGPAVNERISTATGSISQNGLLLVPARADAPDMSASNALLPNTQVPLSALIEAGALIAGNPARYPVGSTIQAPDSVGDDPATVFSVVDDDDFAGGGDYDGEHLPALHLVHEPVSDRDAHIELWLGATLDYLPVGLLIVQPDRQRLGMTLVSAEGRGQ